MDTARSTDPQWTLCRKSKAVPVSDNAMLQRWTEQGRVEPDDYLVSHQLDLCVQAKDIAELDAVFRRTRARLLEKTSRILACAGLVVVWLVPVLGSLLFAVATGTAILSVRTVSHDQAYRVHNCVANIGS